jgi:hypothetical protein
LVSGSGIAVYIVHFHGISVNFSVDEETPHRTITDDRCVYDGCWNFKIYDNQTLAYSRHNLTITALSQFWDDSNGTILYFDYVIVNTTDPLSVTPTPSVPTGASSTPKQLASQ